MEAEGSRSLIQKVSNLAGEEHGSGDVIAQYLDP